MSNVDKLNAIISYKGFQNRAELARFLGLEYQSINNWFRRDFVDIFLLADKLPECSAEWLLRGEGPMLRSSRQPDGAMPIEVRIDGVLYKGAVTKL